MRRTAGSRGVCSASWAGAGLCLQLWPSFAPVADTVSQHFLLSTEQISWLSLAYLVVSIPFGVVAIWVLDSAGLRWVPSGPPVVSRAPESHSQHDRHCVKPPGHPGGQPAVSHPGEEGGGHPLDAKQSSPSTALGLADVHLGMTCGGSRRGAWSSGREAATRVCIRAYPPGSWASTSPLLAPACVWESTPPAPPRPPRGLSIHRTEVPSGAGVLAGNRPTSSWPLAACFGGSIGICSSFSSLLEQILCVNGHSSTGAGPALGAPRQDGALGACHPTGSLLPLLSLWWLWNGPRPPQALGFHTWTG
ncbi:solute carrier family 49 member A3 isoform X3 [Tursiops truncatus]|uniref:solute carrier family 49 member A3 isoform X3 n=1 Tax=Tursiops truncatus TaxID=9739 RepID=UPI003CCFA1F7